ncbi:MAG: hypothetical protein OK457_06430 [Thaumarchaeota archaeon]|nr:hypothetical protein [Nitrososphaerota archaeon]
MNNFKAGKAMTTQTPEESRPAHFPDSNAAKIQTAISTLSEMEKGLDELNDQVAEMKRRLLSFAESESEKAKSSVIDEASREAQEEMEKVRRSAQMEADSIVAKGSSELEVLRSKIRGKVSDAVEIIVSAVQSF